MKRFNPTYLLFAILAVLLVGFYTIDTDTNEASLASLPDFTATSEVKPAEEKPVNTLKDLNDAIVNIADNATPAVVTIQVKQTVEVSNPFQRFFGDPRGGGEERTRRGLGSGVIVSQDGYILTNAHVVENADEITVGLSNGKEYDGKVVGTDPRTDVAVVNIEAEGLSTIKIGNSDEARVGEIVLAIGSPLGQDLAHSVSMGIISAKGRAIGIIDQGAGYENFIQTDAAINPGNSGGAMVNMDGELIGINTAIASRSGGNDGIGFAVPSNLAKSVMESLIKTGKVSRAYLGIYGGNIDRTMARALDIDEAQGILVSEVQDGTPAAEAGLREGDVIRTLNGQQVENYSKFRTSIATREPGSEIDLGIIREGESMNVTVTLGELPDEQTASSTQEPDRNLEEQLGFRAQNLTPDLAERLGLESAQDGVVVTAISRGSNAYRQGLREGDVITSVSRNTVENMSDFNREIKRISDSGDDVVLLRILRGGVNQFIAFEL
ncbi:DegQ family serine endoprotease [Balneolaceae bacterium YR4-1]|uniref:DegQ family serine endoprotease n=1 Tax=Halalkalibaculum roseum TaxID=2709311 RepID=A0A6M1STU2_9BACT|nr:DegQ family serine endoprotease [Halalkalibaculum roseum]NGP75556.1 DegQ family serine endoprotease [Halalkalibaculum roseum]